MSFDISDLPDPENRTTRQHFIFWLRVENAIGQQQQITVNGRSWTGADAEYVTRRRKEYENKLANEAGSSSSTPKYAPHYLG